MSIVKTVKDALAQGQFIKAIAIANTAFEKDNVQDIENELRYLLTVAYRLDGQLGHAQQSGQILIAADTNNARAYQEMGHIHNAKGNVAEAAIAYYRATVLNPALLASWRALVPLYSEMGNKQASHIANHQISYLTSLPKPVLGGRDLMYEGHLYKADQVCRNFLQSNKHHPEALLLLAEIGIQLKIYGEAEFLLETLLELHPQHHAAGVELLKLLAKMGKFHHAKSLADKLLMQQPQSTHLLSAKASAMVGLGEIQEAIPIYKQLLEQDAGQPGLQLLLGHALKASGELDNAINAYKKAYLSRPDFGDAYWSLANTKTYQFSEQEVTNMQEHVANKDVSIEDRIHLHFALGKAFEDSKDYDQAFYHYQQGNDDKQQQTRYDPVVFEQQVDEQITHCNADLFQRFPSAGIKQADPIFIVGLPRAGSTLLEQILASHSQVDGTMELHNILALASKLRGQKNQYPEILSRLETDYFARFGEQFLNDTQIYRAGSPFFIDKMPNNFLHIGLIKLILPNAKIIDARRHPMACCFSGFKQLFGEGQEFTYGLENIGRYYKAYVKLMAHWDRVLPGFVLRVQHEDVIEDLEGQVRRLLDFCGLPFEQSCLDFHKTERAIKTPSSEQVRQPIYRSGMEQWKHFEPYLSPLKTVLGENH